MSDYFFVQSQDPYSETRVATQYQLMRQLQAAGHGVSVLLVQNGVAPARQAAMSTEFDQLLNSGVRVVADSFSLQQREIEPHALKPDIEISDVDSVVAAMLDGQKVIWN